jgi:hypothetical protein
MPPRSGIIPYGGAAMRSRNTSLSRGSSPPLPSGVNPRMKEGKFCLASGAVECRPKSLAHL